MNRYHALATQGELHRPERTGQGNPNDLDLLDVLDGQYFQDTQSGSVYRFVLPDGDTNVANGEWELLLGYDRETGALTNIGDFIQTSKIGETTAIIGKQEGNASGTITAIPARTYVQIRAGEDLRIVDANDTGKEISVTVSQDTNAGEVSIPVQEIKTQKTFQIGSDIIMEGSLFTAYNSVDPTKVQLGVERRDDLDSIGLLGIGISNTATSVTTVSLQKIDPPVILRDDQVIAIKNRAGQSQLLTVSGDQTLSSTTGTITIDAFNPAFTYESSTTAVYEPSYKTSSRITLLDDSISLVVSNVSQVSNSVASLDLRVSSTESSISALSSFDTSVSSAIAGINATTSSLQSQVNVLSAFDTNVTSAIAGVNATTSSLQSQVNVLSAFDTNVTSAIAGINATTNSLSSSISVLSAFDSDVSNSLASINATTNALSSEIVLKTDTNGNIASFQLGSTTGGSAININADQITINNIDFDKDAGTIGSTNYSAGSTGWQIKGNGEAEFQAVKLRSQDFSSNSGGFDLSGAEYQFNKPVSIGGFGDDPSDGKLIMRRSNGDQTGVLYGGQYGVILEDDQGLFIIKGPSSSSINIFGTGNPLSASDQIVIGSKLTVDTTTGTINPSSYSGAADFYDDIKVQGTIDSLVNNDYVIDARDSGGDGMAFGLGSTGDGYFVPVISGTPDFNEKLEFRQANDRWEFSGNVYVAGNIDYVGTLTDVSDAFLKENIEDIGSTLDKVCQLSAKRYDLIGNDNTKEIGLLAQDVEGLFPEIVADRQMTNEDGETVQYKSLSYIQLVPILIESIKDLKQEVEQLKQQINLT